jgi:hypothetical protein
MGDNPRLRSDDVSFRHTPFFNLLELLQQPGCPFFSTFEYETHSLFDEGSWLLAMANVFGSLFVGLLAVHLGMVLSRRWL